MADVRRIEEHDDRRLSEADGGHSPVSALHRHQEAEGIVLELDNVAKQGEPTRPRRERADSPQFPSPPPPNQHGDLERRRSTARSIRPPAPSGSPAALPEECPREDS